MKTKTKNQKPIDFDCHLKYRCPNDNCGYFHWLSLKETQTKNFKIVCDCGTIFRPKQVSKFKLLYRSSENKKTKCESLPSETKEKCINTLIGYGFDHTEAELLINKSFEVCKTIDVAILIKHAIKQLGEPK